MTSKPETPTSRIVIAGGGSAGWITAALIAAKHAQDPGRRVAVTLVESPQIAMIGVGEGTWPTMRTTLERIGIAETTFLKECSASFKQGTRFVDWVDGRAQDVYYHPFTPPAGYPHSDLATAWLQSRGKLSFADAVSPQGMVCDRNLGPKQFQTPEYAGVLNYAYHLDAGRFADLLARHCTGSLGVRHIQDHITGVETAENGDIAALETASSGPIRGELFIDCSGMRSMLLGEHYGVALVDRSDVLFNNTALAIQVPYAATDTPVASQTISTARPCGWIWDIGLTSRRGAGYVYSSHHCNDDEAWRVLERYLHETGAPADAIQPPRRITFSPGYRQHFWHRNCVAVGMSSGFIEPLEASALVMVELAGRMIAEELPVDRQSMDIVARRFNRIFRYRWERIIDFLKLHYILSKRQDSAYWHDNRSHESIPESLRDMMQLWRFRPPGQVDLPHFDEVFSAASYQYVLYGMGFQPAQVQPLPEKERANASRLVDDNVRLANQCLARLPTNRALLDKILQHRLPAAG